MNANEFVNKCSGNTPMSVRIGNVNVLPVHDGVVLAPSGFYLSGDFTPEQKDKAVAAVKEAVGDDRGWQATVHVRVPGHGGRNGKRCTYSASAPEPDVATERALSNAVRNLESDVARWEALVKHANKALRKLRKQQVAVRSVISDGTVS